MDYGILVNWTDASAGTGTAYFYIDGVLKADVIIEKAEAKVTFDDAKTNVEALLKATKNAGYPSRPK